MGNGGSEKRRGHKKSDFSFRTPVPGFNRDRSSQDCGASDY